MKNYKKNLELLTTNHVYSKVMEHDALQIQQSGSTFMVIVNATSLGYNLDTDDEIKAWGKFNG